MVVIIRPEDIPAATSIMEKYGSKLYYSKLKSDGQDYLAIEKGPIAAILKIRAELGRDEDHRKFHLL